MISRRTIRTKVLQILYAYYYSPDKSFSIAEKELNFALSKTYDLYHLLILLAIELADFSQRKIDSNLSKLRPSYEDLHPNTKLLDNSVIRLLRENRQLRSYLKNSGLTWANHPELVRDLYEFLCSSDFFNDYTKSNSSSFAEDKRFVEKIFQNIILITEDLHIVLEEESIYWNDDIDLVVAMILKTLKNFTEKSDENQPLLPKYKDIEDEQFALALFGKTIVNETTLKKMIETHSNNWDLERIAFMDILIMQLALAEFLYFPSIPTKVTLNEYIELSKYYSTDKSRNFINGILDRILKELKNTHQINKAGRGLIGETL